MSPARGSADCEDADVDFIFNLFVPLLMMAGEVPIAPEMQMLTVMVWICKNRDLVVACNLDTCMTTGARGCASATTFSLL